VVVVLKLLSLPYEFVSQALFFSGLFGLEEVICCAGFLRRLLKAGVFAKMLALLSLRLLDLFLLLRKRSEDDSCYLTLSGWVLHFLCSLTEEYFY